MTATFQAAQAGQHDVASGAQTATSITGGATANRFIAILINLDRVGTVSSVQCNGNAMSTGVSFSNTAGGDSRLYYLAGDSNVSSGSNSITWTNDAGQGYWYEIAVWNGVDSAAPYSNGDSLSSAGSSSYNKTFTSVTGDIVGVLGYCGTSTIVVSNSGSTTVEHQAATTGTFVVKDYTLDRPGAASAQIDIQYDATGSVNIAGWSLKSATGGGATAVTLSGPSTGAVNTASSNFNIGVNATPITGTLIVTPATSISGGGSFSPTTVSLTTGSPSATVTFTPTKSGSHTITCSDDGGLTDPTPLTYAVRPEVTLTLVTSPSDSTPRANLSNLKWAWFDAVTPDALSAPTDKGATETTNGSGVITIPLANSTKTNGQVGWLVISDSDGTTTQSPPAKMFSGPAAVT